MLKHLMEALNVDRDGAVRRTEFDPPPEPPVLLSPNEREMIEAFLFDHTDSRFQYVDRHGKKGVVFYDSRGRAAAGLVSEMGDSMILRLAKEKGYEYVPSAEPHPEVEV